MMTGMRRSGPCRILICLALAFGVVAMARAQDSPPLPARATLEALSLEPARRLALTDALQRRDYTRAETILVETIDAETARDPKSAALPDLLSTVGGIFFLNGEWLNAAISFKKAEALRPLGERDRFTLAMAYIRLARPDWARPELTRLTGQFPQNALYLYWLARIDYDAQQYTAAIAKLEKVVALDPQMMRAYDNLGLCYDYLGRFDEAIKYFRQAIELNRKQPQPSPWPHLNLAITLLARNQVSEAEEMLREALRYDARLPQAHYQLGLALDRLNRAEEAIQSLTQATQLDPAYPEPHYALGRIYQKRGEKEKAREALARFQELKDAKRYPRR